MKYNFDEIINRKGSNSIKYDLCDKIFGTSDLIPMWVADMDFKTPDFIIKALEQRLKHPVLGYSLRPDSYYKSIINWNKKKHNWNIKQEWISFSPGVVPGFNMAILALSKPGDKIIIQPPVYFPFFTAINNNNRIEVDNTLVLKNNYYDIDFDDLEEKMKDAKIFLLSNPHNPGGRVWTRAELKRIGEMCIKNDVIILSDEIHSDLIMKNHKHIPMASISEEIAERTICFMAPSKTFNIAGLSTSYLVISNEVLRKKYEQVVENLHVNFGNIFGTSALEVAYNFGEDWLKQLIDYVQANIDFAADYLKKNIPEIKLVRPEATYLLWLDCRDLNMSNEELKDFMINKAKLGLNDGPTFGPGGEGFQRMNVACPRSTLAIALDRIKNAVEKIR
ncbi:MAG: PatB family C-S lyase [Bacteroidales bacterium]|nr:PatB family C-S lyase [Bacteroidales bacterium]